MVNIITHCKISFNYEIKANKYEDKAGDQPNKLFSIVHSVFPYNFILDSYYCLDLYCGDLTSMLWLSLKQE